MLEVDRMETATTEVTSIWRRNDIENSTWRTHRYFVDFESRIHVEIPRRIESSNPPYQITNCFSMSYNSSFYNLISRKKTGEEVLLFWRRSGKKEVFLKIGVPKVAKWNLWTKSLKKTYEVVYLFLVNLQASKLTPS